MATIKRTSTTVTVSTPDADYEGRIYFARASHGNLVLKLRAKDARKKDESPWPISITFDKAGESFEFMAKAMAWAAKGL